MNYALDVNYAALGTTVGSELCYIGCYHRTNIMLHWMISLEKQNATVGEISY